MCQASISVDQIREVQPYDRLVLGKSKDGLPVFRNHEDQDRLIVCVRNDRVLIFEFVPQNVQEDLNIQPTIVATFVEKGDDVSDQICLSDGRVLDLCDLLPNDVRCGQDSVITVTVGAQFDRGQSPSGW